MYRGLALSCHQRGYVFIVVCLLVSRIMQKLLDRFLKNFDIKVAHAPWKNPLDVGGNANHDYVTVGWRISHIGRVAVTVCCTAASLILNVG